MMTFPRAVAALLCLATLAGAQPSARQNSDPRIPAGGNGTLYVGTYAKDVLVIDEATMKVRDTIRSSIGIPAISLSFDKRHLYLSDPGSEKVEIIDLATKKSLGQISLSSGNTKVRMWGFSLDPR